MRLWWNRHCVPRSLPAGEGRGYKTARTRTTGAMGKISGDCVGWMVDHVYRNLDVFRLLLC